MSVWMAMAWMVAGVGIGLVLVAIVSYQVGAKRGSWHLQDIATIVGTIGGIAMFVGGIAMMVLGVVAL